MLRFRQLRYMGARQEAVRSCSAARLMLHLGVRELPGGGVRITSSTIGAAASSQRGVGLVAIIAIAPAAGVELICPAGRRLRDPYPLRAEDMRRPGWRSGRLILGQAAPSLVLVPRIRSAVRGAAHGVQTGPHEGGEEVFVRTEMGEDDDWSGRDEAERPAVPV